MTCPAMMFLSISAILALLHGQADAVELESLVKRREDPASRPRRIWSFFQSRPRVPLSLEIEKWWPIIRAANIKAE